MSEGEVIEISLVQAWLLLTLAIAFGFGCYAVGVRIGARIVRSVEEKYGVSLSDDDARRVLR